MKKLMLVILSLPIILSIGLLALGFATHYWYKVKWVVESDIPFESEKWKNGTIPQTLGNSIEPYRHRMISDLLENKRLVGKPKQEVINMLGSQRNYMDDIYQESYWLTSENGTDIDPIAGKNLVLTYNDKDILINAEIVTWEH